MSCALSVIIPTHNRPEMLAEALASVRAQIFTDYEIIVVSNGEDAEMREAVYKVVADHHCRYGARYCRFFDLPEANVSAARNFGVERAKGEWIAFLDDDDIWFPNKLERQLAAAKRTGADMIAADWVAFYPDGREVVFRMRCPDGWPYVKAISHGHWWAAMGSLPLIRKAVFAEIGGFDVSFRRVEDIDLTRRIAWRHIIHQMDEVLMRYRCGHGRLSRDKRRVVVGELRHFYKMRRDTPADLRWTLPSATLFVAPRLFLLCWPKWFLAMLGAIGPRRRWSEFRHWLRWEPHPRPRPRTRWIAFRHWLRWGPHPRLRPRTRWIAFRHWFHWGEI